MTSDYQGQSESPPQEEEYIQNCLTKIVTANNLEQSGEFTEAIAIYQEVLELDEDGTYGEIAKQALSALENSGNWLAATPPLVENSELETHSPAGETDPFPQSLLQKFYNLPILSKQLIGLLTSEVIWVAGLMGIGSLLMISWGRSQLEDRAKSELTVMEMNYNIKIDQMGLGFRAQSDNAAVKLAATTYAKNKSLKPDLYKQVKEILQNEITAGQIEYATLVGLDKRIIVNANADRQGELFDPNGLVSSVLQNPQQIKTSDRVSLWELQKEKAPLPEGINNENALIRYTVTPVTDRATNSVIGVLVSGDIVDGKLPIVENTLESFNGGYSAVYLRQTDNSFALATSIEEGAVHKLTQISPALPNMSLLNGAVNNSGKPVNKRLNLQGKSCSIIPFPWSPKCYTMAAVSLPNNAGEPVAVLVRGSSENSLNGLLGSSLLLVGLVAIASLLLDLFVALLLGRAIVTPLKKLGQIVGDFAAGNRQVRAKAIATDEIGALTKNFNLMADGIVAMEANLTQTSRQQAFELEKQLKENEQLQQDTIKLLLEIEAAQTGDLTVTGEVTDGVVGSIADAFNSTIRKLRELVLQVQNVSEEVNTLSQDGEKSVCQFSNAASIQSKEINQALNAVKAMNGSIKNIANSANEAASIAKKALSEAKMGDTTMDRTVESIEKIRSSVAGTAKKVKQLAESSQEISQIVEIISNISEKTNLLAFNASVEASRAGEHGQGFRIVADEVRSLADRVKESTEDIQHLVRTIQQDTSAVLEAMETSTTEVVTGTKLVGNTKQTLQGLAVTSQKIDQYLQSISVNTTHQTNASHQVSQRMEEVASIAQDTSTDAQEVVTSLQALVEEAEDLQLAISHFIL